MKRPKLKKLIAAGLAALTVMAAVPTIPAEAAVSMDDAINWALAIAADDSYGYSQDSSKRWGTPSYDCSAFVISALRAGGYETGSASYTGNMVSELTKYGWTALLADDLDTTSGYSNLKRGDILLRRTSSSGHTELYIGSGKVVKAAYDEDGVDGDSSGLEIRTGNYYDGKWTYVLRYTGSSSAVTTVSSETSTTVPTTSFTKSSSTVNTITVTWKSLSTVSGYEVSYSTSKSGTYARAYVTSGNSYTLECGKASTTYYFKIRPYILVSGVRIYADYSDIYTAKTGAAGTAAAAVTTNASLNLRIGAGTSYTRLTTIPKSTALIVTGITKTSSGDIWYQVSYSGYTGYVAADYTTVQVAKVSSISKSAVAEGAVTIAWSAVEYADYYQIYRSTSKSGSYKKIKTVKASSLKWTDTSVSPSTYYYYKVRGLVKISGVNYVGSCSSVLKVKSAASTVTAIDCQVKTVYEAALRNGAGVSNTKLTDIPAGKILTASEIKLDSSGDPWYKVVYGSKTGYISAVTMKIYVPQVTDVKKTSVGETTADISWTAVSNASKYAVYRSTSKSSGYSKIGEVKTNSFSDSGLTESTTYYYKVRAYQTVDGTSYYGLVSAPAAVKTAKKTSIEVTCQIKTVYEAALRSDAGTSYTKYTDIPADEILTASAIKPDSSGDYWYKVTYDGQTGFISPATMKVYVPQVTGLAKSTVKTSLIKITWTAAANADSYAVYRSTSKNSGYSRIGVTTSRAYTDKTVSAGKTYYYKVRAYQTVNGTTYHGLVSSPIKITAAAEETTVESSDSVLYNILTTGSLNMRSGPALSYDQVTTVPSGTSLEAYAAEDDERGVTWYQVTYDGYTGWISSKYAEIVS